MNRALYQLGVRPIRDILNHRSSVVSGLSQGVSPLSAEAKRKLLQGKDLPPPEEWSERFGTDVPLFWSESKPIFPMGSAAGGLEDHGRVRLHCGRHDQTLAFWAASQDVRFATSASVGSPMPYWWVDVNCQEATRETWLDLPFSPKEGTIRRTHLLNLQWCLQT